MDSQLQASVAPKFPITVSVVLLFCFCCYLLLWKPRNGKRSGKNKAPEPAGAWPIIGHLHLFSGQEQGKLPHIILGAMADKYGPAFTIRLGIHRALVVSSSEVAKECYTIRDRAFATRPISIALKIMGYNNAMFGFTPYGPYWREVRKIVMVELLSNRRLELLKNVWHSEIDLWIKELYDTTNSRNNENSSLVDMKQWFEELSMNIVARLVAGKRRFGKINKVAHHGDQDEEAAAAKAHQRQLKALRQFFTLVNSFLVEDALPFLTWLDLQGYQREMKSIAKELDILLQEWLEEHKLKEKVGSGGMKKGEQQDFMDVMLSIVQDSTIADRDADTVCKATCLNVILGASDTTMITLTWAISLLLNHRQVLQKARDELDAHVGKRRDVEEFDVKNLVYIQAITKEVLRLYPAAPLSVARESLEDTVVAGYHVPVGTQIITNLWKIQRDLSVWPQPSEFQPERFLTTHKDIDVSGQDFKLIPFGSGRRSCPGMSFVLQVVPLALARLIHCFELTTPGGAPVDMTESAGLTNVKVTPVEVFVTPRLFPFPL